MDIEEEKKVLLESNRKKCKKFYGDAWETLDQHQKTDCIDNPREHINPKGDSPPQGPAKKKPNRKAQIRQLHQRDQDIDRLKKKPPAGEAEARCREFYGDKWDDLDPNLKKGLSWRFSRPLWLEDPACRIRAAVCTGWPASSRTAGCDSVCVSDRQ